MTPDPSPPSPEALEEAREIIEAWQDYRRGDVQEMPILMRKIAQALQEKEDECQRLREEKAESWALVLSHEGRIEQLQAKLSEREKECYELHPRLIKAEAKLSDAVGKLAQALEHCRETNDDMAKAEDIILGIHPIAGEGDKLAECAKFVAERLHTAEAKVERLRNNIRIIKGFSDNGCIDDPDSICFNAIEGSL